jgi:glucose-1-phosphate thymidylyltransferase
MKGVILAGGKATRLYPITKGTCKQLLSVYDKPMIYYPLSILMLAGIQDILIITTPDDMPHFKNLFGDGRSLGLRISYQKQTKPKGLAHAFILGENFIGQDRVCLVLGDNIFYGDRLGSLLKEAIASKKGSTIFAYGVTNPERYGVVEFDPQRRPVQVVEKPKIPKSNWAVPGLYFFDHHVTKIAKGVKPSARGELEISEIINAYMKKSSCEIVFMGRGMAWLDTGTYDSLLDASLFIKIIEERQGLKIGCIEEIAYREGFISKKKLIALAAGYKTSYGDYLRKIINENNIHPG